MDTNERGILVQNLKDDMRFFVAARTVVIPSCVDVNIGETEFFRDIILGKEFATAKYYY